VTIKTRGEIEAEMMKYGLAPKHNMTVVQHSLRPQSYATGSDAIATGQVKAQSRGHSDMLSHWGADLVRKGWLDAIPALSLPPQGEQAIAVVNHSRWFALCPDERCAGGEVVSPDAPVFMCLSCGNKNNLDKNGIIRLRQVAFPDDRIELEKVLLERPDPVSRNWYPTETIEDLQEENKRHLG